MGRELTARSFIKTASQKNVIKRALIMAGIVGTVLIAVNHGSCILGGGTCGNCFLKSGITLLVPYCVSTVSSVLAIDERNKNPQPTEG